MTDEEYKQLIDRRRAFLEAYRNLCEEWDQCIWVDGYEWDGLTVRELSSLKKSHDFIKDWDYFEQIDL